MDESKNVEKVEEKAPTTEKPEDKAPVEEATVAKEPVAKESEATKETVVDEVPVADKECEECKAKVEVLEKENADLNEKLAKKVKKTKDSLDRKWDKMKTKELKTLRGRFLSAAGTIEALLRYRKD